MPKIPNAIKYRAKRSLGTDSVVAAWDRIETWLADHLPATRQALRPPASLSEVKAFEATIGHELPPAVRESYRIHNGHRGISAGVLFGLPLLALDDALRQWKTWKDYDRSKKTKHNFDDEASCFPVGHVQSVFFTKNWIPISHDSGGNHIAIDMAPGSGGTVGQVIICGRDDTFHPVLAVDWAQFLADIADELERGNWRIEYHETENDYEFNLGAPQTSHFHDAGASWSRCKLGLRKLSPEDDAVWNRQAGKK